MSQKKALTPSEEFAQLLYNSIIPDEIKKRLLKQLTQLDEKQLLQIYRILKTEESRREQVMVKLDVKANKLRKSQ